MEQLQEVVICVNNHYRSGYSHVNAQTKENIFINFLKKKVTSLPSCYIFRIKARDIKLSMEDNSVVYLRFTNAYDNFEGMKHCIGSLNNAALDLDYEELKKKSSSSQKFLQQTDKIINSIKEFSFSN